MKIPPAPGTTYYVKGEDPWVKIFVDFLRPLCDNNGMLSKDRLLEVTGWESLQTPWGYNLPFSYTFKKDQVCYIVLKQKGKDIG
jgi:hypothetical protein